ncbi:MAG: insulinase family protein [Pirellulales bacterium]|nr:insulinase family protein [Pirellulales bacterium]
MALENKADAEDSAAKKNVTGKKTADKDDAAKPTPPTYKRKQKLPGQITLATLSNGLTVIVQENHTAPVATVRCFVKNTGGAFESKYLGMGISHLVEHIVAGGATTTRTEKEIEEIVDRFGGATNAYTSNDLTAYFIDCPAGNTMTCIDLIADTMQNAIFEQEAFDREFKVVQRELFDGEANRSRVKWSLINETIYTDHPAHVPTIGYLEVLKTATRDIALDFYRSRYVPNNQIFVVVGDIKTDEVLDRIARAWIGTPRSRETYIPMVADPLQVSPREAVREMDGNTYDMALAWPTAKLSSPDLYALDVAAYILAEGESSRMIQNLKYDKQLVLSVSSASYTPYFVDGWFGIFATAQPETWKKASDAIIAEVYRLREELVSPAELEKAKKQKAAELVFSQQKVQDAAGSLGRGYLSTADPRFDHAYAENIQKVTAEQVRDVARRYFLPQRLNRIIIAPPGGAPKAADADNKSTEGKIVSLNLDNGLRVLVKRNSQLPLVNIQAYILGGSLVDSVETAGRAGLVGKMLDKGTARHSAQQIADFFDSRGGKFSTAAGRNTVYATATVLADDFPDALALLAESFTQPTFPQDQFEKVQHLALGAIARRAANPQQEVLELFFDNLPNSSPYHILQGGKKETVERLTADNLRSYHAKYFVPNNMIVTVFGDIDPDKAVDLVRKNFGSLKPNPDLEPISFDRPNAIAKSIVRHKQTKKTTAMVMLGYPDTSILDKTDYAAMTVLDAIMSGYSYPGGWLHTELRGQGLVYYVHAMQITGPSPGFFSIMAQTRPDKLDEVVDRIRKNVQRVKDGKISQKEFDTAIQMIISLHAQENTTSGTQAQQAALDELYGLGYDYDKSFEDRIKAVTLEDVIRVANKYLGNSVLATTSPEKK